MNRRKSRVPRTSVRGTIQRLISEKAELIEEVKQLKAAVGIYQELVERSRRLAPRPCSPDQTLNAMAVREKIAV